MERNAIVKQRIRVENPAKLLGATKQEAKGKRYRWEFEPKDYSSASKYAPLWQEWHTKENPTLGWIADWLNRVPKNCNCGKSFSEWLAANKPDFDNWFEYSVDGHNFVNRKLKKIEYGPLDARLLVDGLPLDGSVQLIKPTILSQVPEPTRDRALLVLVADDKTRKEYQHTGERMRQYALNHDLDFVEITEISKQTHSCGNKYAYTQIADRWQQTLWLDTDVVVDPNAPTIFDEVPAGSWGLVDDLAVMENTDWFVSEFQMCQGVWGVPISALPSAWNSGVVVAPNNAVECYYPPPMRVPNVWCAEQHWHTQCLLDKQASVVTLNEQWNNGYPWHRWHKQIPTSWFNHANGCKPQSLRIDILKHLADGNTSLSESLIERAKESWRPRWTQA
jgi:hypothetical protein